MSIRNDYHVAAPVLFTTNVVPATVGLTSPIAAGQRQKIRAWVPFNVGATGGIRALIAVPAGGALARITYKLFNTVAPTITTAEQVASGTPFTNAVANAGNSWIEIEADFTNGSTAGVVDVQFAQNTSDANTLTILQGGSLDVTIF